MRILLTGLAFLMFGCLNESKEKSLSLAREAYLQLEIEPLSESNIDDAAQKILKAKSLNDQESWVYISDSFEKLVRGYKTGSWTKKESFDSSAISESFVSAKIAVQYGENVSEAYSHLARLYIIIGDHESAWPLLNKAYKLNPNNFYSYYFRGILYQNAMNPEKAEQEFDKAESCIKYRHQSRLLNIHRRQVAEITGDTVKQEALLRENIMNDPGAAVYYSNYAFYLMNHNRFDEAELNWKKSIQISPTVEAETYLKETVRARDSVYRSQGKI